MCISPGHTIQHCHLAFTCLTLLHFEHVCVGATNTEMLNTSLKRFMDDTHLESFVKGLPKGSLIDPEDVR